VKKEKRKKTEERKKERERERKRKKEKERKNRKNRKNQEEQKPNLEILLLFLSPFCQIEQLIVVRRRLNSN